MMRTAILMVTALVAASSATPWGSRANKQCAAYCRETSKFDYNVGTIYTYEYAGETTTKISGTSEDESRLHINAKAELEVVSKCEMILRLKDVGLEESDPTDASIRTKAEGSSAFAAALERHPLVFSFQDGEVEHLCPSDDEETWTLNIKRGVVSAMQNSMKQVEVSQKVYETDVSGHCETNYTVTNQGRNGVTIKRSKNLLSCTGRNSHESTIQATTYSSASSIQSLPLLKSETECQQTIRNQRLEKSVCTETHLFRPFSNENSGALTKISQSLTYRQERSSDEVPTDFKRTRASLLFDDSDQVKAATAGNELAAVTALNQLIQESRRGVTAKVPQLFSQLVTALRPLNYRQMSSLFINAQDQKAKKFLMDAAPLVGTAASYELMRDIIQEGLLSAVETDMWLSSLAFQTKPTLDMITAVSPLLSGPEVRPKALLSISAMIHAYCQTHSECAKEEGIRKVVTDIEKRLGKACRSIDTKEEEVILLALKAIGNAGVIVNSADTLKKCYEEENAMIIRLAAIEAHRRVPCSSADRSSLLTFFRDMKQDSELRIAAYLAVMHCPTPQLFEEIKQALTSEAVNQVGSFVWTHLTNLQETSSPSKQAIRHMLSSEFLRNKFNTDVRKFSRNIEASAFWDELNAGGSVESNVIFSTKSYLPRSATLNLTLDLFGQSVNLFELGGRIEGFESLVESFLVPKDPSTYPYPKEAIEKLLQSMRTKRAVDQKSLNQLAAAYDPAGHLGEDQPSGHLFLRVFGNDVHTHSFHGLSSDETESPLSMLLRLALQKDIDFTKTMSLIDARYIVPTVVGLPLTLSVNGTATVQLRMGGTFQVRSLSDLDVIGHIKPSATMQINGVMSVDTGFIRTGVQVKSTMHATDGVQGKIVVRGSKVVSVHVDAPEETTNLFSYDTNLFIIHKNQKRAIQPTNQIHIIHQECSPSWVSHYLGLQLCGELDFYPPSKSGPRGPLSGPSHAAIVLHKTDTQTSYNFDYSWTVEQVKKQQIVRTLVVTMDTPDSKINRKLSTQITMDEAAKSLRAFFTSPYNSAELVGKYEFTDVLKGADVLLIVDGAEVGSVRTSVRTDVKGQTSRVEPSLVISKRNKDILNFQGFYAYQSSSKFSYDFQLKHLTFKPIRVAGDVSKDNDKTEINMSVKSYLLDTSTLGTFRYSDKFFNSKIKVDYSLMEGPSHSLETSTKFNRLAKGALNKVSVAGVIQGTQFPLYNTDFSWDLQQSRNYLENNVRMAVGSTQWDMKQTFSDLTVKSQRDWNAVVSVVCLQNNVDFLLSAVQKRNDTNFVGKTILRLSPGREWSAQVDLIRRPHPLHYAAGVDVSTPTTSRQIRAELIEKQQKQWDLSFEYGVDKEIDTSITATYKNVSSGTKSEYAADLKIRSSLLEDTELTCSFSLSPTSVNALVQGRYGEEDVSASLDYHRARELEHSLVIKANNNEKIVFKTSFNINLARHKSLAFTILAGRRVTFDFSFNPDGSTLSTNVELYWNKDVDPSRSFKFSGQYSGLSGHAIMEYPGQSVQMRIELRGKDLIALVQWDDEKQIRLDLEMENTSEASTVNGRLSTPFEGYERITFVTVQKGDKTLTENKLSVEWRQERFSLTVKNGKAKDYLSGAVEVVSTFANLERFGGQFESLCGQREKRYLLSAHHQGRQAKILATLNQNEILTAALQMVTPIAGYESLKATLTHDLQGSAFQSDLKVEGPFESQALLTVSGKRIASETAGSLVLSTNTAWVTTCSTSFQLLQSKEEKKMTVVTEFNGQQAVLEASGEFKQAGMKSKLSLKNPWTEEITASIQHQNSTKILTEGSITWSTDKKILVTVNGEVNSKNDIQLNGSLIAPGFKSSAEILHKYINGKIESFIKAQVNDQTVKLSVDADSKYGKSEETHLIKGDLSTPFSGWEQVSVTVKHRSAGLMCSNRMEIEKVGRRTVVEHSTEHESAFNWAHQLSVTTPFSGLASVGINAKQLWKNGRLQHSTKMDLNGQEMALMLDSNLQSEKLTASGSFVSTWSEDFTFQLDHIDNNEQFHPVLVLRTGSSPAIRLEVTFKRSPKMPSLTIDLVSPVSEPIQLKAVFNRESAVKTTSVQLTWNGDRKAELTFEWLLDPSKTVIKSELKTPMEKYSKLGAEFQFDLTGDRKTASATVGTDSKKIHMEAFAVPKGSSFQAEISVNTPFKSLETMKASAVVDIADFNTQIRLSKGEDQIELLGSLMTEPTKTTVTVTFTSPIKALKSIRLEGSLTTDQEMIVNLDVDGRKMTLDGAYKNSENSKSIRASLQTPFQLLQFGSVEAAYDFSSPSKTASLLLKKEDQVIEFNGQATAGVKAGTITVGFKAPNIRNLDLSGSYDVASNDRTTGQLNLDVNGEKYELEGQLVNGPRNGKVTFKTVSTYLGYETVTLDAEYDARKPVKTAKVTFAKNEDRLLVAGQADLTHPHAASASVELTTPIEVLRTVRLQGKYDVSKPEKTVQITATRNQDAVTWAASGSYSAKDGKFQTQLDTPFEGYEQLKAQVQFDTASVTKTASAIFEHPKQAKTIRTDAEYKDNVLTIRTTTPFDGYESFNLIGKAVVDEFSVDTSLQLEQNKQKVQASFDASIERKEASFKFESPLEGFEKISGHSKWNFDLEQKNFQLNVVVNDFHGEADLNGNFASDHSGIAFKTKSSLNGWQSATLTAAYDIRTSLSGNLLLEKNGVEQAYSGEAVLTKESAKVVINTPFEGMRTIGASGKLQSDKNGKLASISLEKDGEAKTLTLAINFDANSAIVELETPFQDFRTMSAKIRYVVQKELKNFNVILTKNEQRVELNGALSVKPKALETEIKFASTFIGFESIVVSIQSKNGTGSATQSVSAKVTVNEKVVEAFLSSNMNMQDPEIKVELKTPFVGYEEMDLSFGVKQSKTMALITFKKNGEVYLAEGLLTPDSKGVNVVFKTPMTGYEHVEIKGRWALGQVEIDVNLPAGKTTVTAEYDVTSPLKFARLIVNNGEIRYQNEFNAKFDMRAAALNLNIQTPLEGFNNISSSFIYNVGDANKSGVFVVDTGFRRYESTAKISRKANATEVVVHLQTPLAGFEEIDLSSGYDRLAKNVYFINERNGKPLIRLLASSVYKPTSSNMVLTVSVPVLTDQEIDLSLSHDLTAVNESSVEAKVKLGPVQVLIQGKHSRLESAVLSVSTTFDIFREMQINWDLTPSSVRKTASFTFDCVKQSVKVALDAHVKSEDEMNLHLTFSAPLLGLEDQSLDLEWDGTKNGKMTGRMSYAKKSCHLSTDLTLNYSLSEFALDFADAELIVKSNKAGWEHVQVTGRLVNTEEIQAHTTIQWEETKKMELDFNGQFSVDKSWLKSRISAPFFQTIKAEGQYNVKASDKSARIAYSYGTDVHQSNLILTGSSNMKWNAKFNTVSLYDKYTVTAQCDLESQLREINLQLENGDHISKLRITAGNKSERSVLTVTFNSPSLGINEWHAEVDCDSSKGLSTSATLSWAPERSIRLAGRMSPVELSASLTTPFSGFEKTEVVSKFDFDSPKQVVDVAVFWGGKKLTLAASAEALSNLSFRITTPFQGFEEIGLNAAYVSGDDYSVTLSYNRAGQVVELKGKMVANSAGSAVKMTFDSSIPSVDDLSAIIEYDLNSDRKTASALLSRGSKKVTISAAAQLNDKTGGFISIDSSEFRKVRFSLDIDTVAQENLYTLAMEYGAEKMEVIAGWKMSSSVRSIRLEVQTPFSGFEKIFFSTKVDQTTFDAKLDLTGKQQFQLNGDYLTRPSMFSVNGTLQTPFTVLDNVSWKTFADFRNDIYVSGSVQTPKDGNMGFRTAFRQSSLEIAVDSPFEYIRNGKVSAVYELHPESHKKLGAAFEYNKCQGSLDGTYTNQDESITLFTQGSFNGKSVSMESKYLIEEDNSVKVSGSIVTPFEGLSNFTAVLVLGDRNSQKDYHLYVETPLETIPSLDMTLQTVSESGRRFEVAVAGSTMGHSGKVKLSFKQTAKTYSGALDLETPFLKQFPSAQFRTDFKTESWKEATASASAKIPSGQYSAEGSYFLDGSSLKVSGDVKSPSFSQSILMGAIYSTGEDHAEGEVFVGNNKVEGRVNKRGDQITGEIGLILPAVRVEQTSFNVDVNVSSAHKVKAIVTGTTSRHTHTFALNYDLTDTEFSSKVEFDSPTFQPKKMVSVTAKYANISTSGYSLEAKYSGASSSELTASVQTGDKILVQSKLNSPMVSAAFDLTAGTTDGKLAVTVSDSTHQFAYIVDVVDGYQLSVSAESSLIHPVQVSAKWMSNEQEVQSSLLARYGETAHSAVGGYLRQDGKVSFNVTSPYLPSGELSLAAHFDSTKTDKRFFNVDLNVLGQSHHLSTHYQPLPEMSTEFRIESSAFSWSTAAVQFSGRYVSADEMELDSSLTYGEKQRFGLSGNLRNADLKDFGVNMTLTTPLTSFQTASTRLRFNALNGIDSILEVETSHPKMPRASFNLRLQKNVSAYDASFGLTTPLKAWPSVGVAVKVPLFVSDADARLVVTLPKKQYSVSGLLEWTEKKVDSKLEIDLAGSKYVAKLILKADDIYQVRVDVTTPVRGYENYSWDIKGQASVQQWGEATAFLDWNGKRIELTSNVKAQPRTYIAVFQLNTPFAGFERYAVHIRLEGTDRKTLQVELEYPGTRVGADFDYVFNSKSDFVGKASIRTPYAGYESFTVHLSNQMTPSGYTGNAEAVFADYGLSSNVQVVFMKNGFDAKSGIRFNDKDVIVFKSSGLMDDNGLKSELHLSTWFEKLRTVDSFFRVDRNPTVDKKGFGLTVNDRQIFLISLDQQEDGTQTLQLQNPWRPMTLSYSLEHNAQLIHYQAQFCWDLNRRSESTIGGQLLVKSSSYSQQIRFKAVLPKRSVGFSYALESTSSKLDHALSVSWSEGKSVGYRVLLDNTSASRRTQLDSLFRLDLLSRSIEVESHRIVTSTDSSAHAELKWDASRDHTKRMGFRFETSNTGSSTKGQRKARLVLIHSALVNEIVLSGDSSTLGGDAKTTIHFKYSPEVDHLFTVEIDTQKHQTTTQKSITIRHPATLTDINLSGALASTKELFQLDARLEDRFNATRFLQVSTKIQPIQRQIDIELRTATNSLAVSSTLVRGTGDIYEMTTVTTLNDVDSLSVRSQLNIARPEFQAVASCTNGIEFNVYAGMPSSREVMVRASRDFQGRTVTDGHFNLKLNTTSVLSSRVYWRAASVAELRKSAIKTLVNVLATSESLASGLAGIMVSDISDKQVVVLPVVQQIFERVSTNMADELMAIRFEFREVIAEVATMYEQNQFYLRDLIEGLYQMADVAKPYVQRTVVNLIAIQRAIIGEGTAFYKAVSHTYNTLFKASSSIYSQLIVLVKSTVSEASRQYSMIAGEVVSRLVVLETQIGEFVQYIQHMYLEHVNRLEQTIMNKVNEFRQKVIELVDTYTEDFKPYIIRLRRFVEYTREVFTNFGKTVEDFSRVVYDRMMEYAPLKKIVLFYMKYASWFEEFHAHEYMDQVVAYFNQIKKDIQEEFRTLTAAYKPIIDPIVQAIDGQMEALKQLPIINYLNTVAERLALQVQELYKYIELEAKLRNILRQVLRHTDRLSNQLIQDLKGAFDFPWRPIVVMDIESGRFELTQKLPVTWESFHQMPRLAELPVVVKLALARRNLLRNYDYTPFYFATMDAFATYRPMVNIKSILPPFGSHAMVAGTQHYMTFDRRFYEFAGECSYLLVSDFFHNNFSVVANYEGANNQVTRKSLTVLSDGRQIEIDSNFRVTLNSKKIELPLVYEKTSIIRDGQRVIIANENGFSVNCNLHRDICTVHVSGWSFGKTGGLFGVYNNEPADDFTTPYRQVRSDQEVDSFANSWKVGTSRCRVRNFAAANPATSLRNTRLCHDLFAKNDSALRPCFGLVNPEPYSQMCLNDLASLENSARKEMGVCTAAAAYVTECRLAGLDLFVPAQCARCELENGMVIGSGDIKSYNNDAPRSADVVFLVDYKNCLYNTRLSNLPPAIEAALKDNNINQNRFAVVGYGGQGIFAAPHVRTAEGQIWSNRLSIQSALEDLPLVNSDQPGDVFAALRYAVNLPYRAGVSKQFVLVSCGSDCQANSYADALTLLIENDIKLHLLQPRDLKVKGRTSSEEIKNVYGFDADGVYTVRNIRSLKGDRELRRHLALPKDFCTPLALETNGTLFDLKKMNSGNGAQVKKFVDIFARRVAVTAEPSPCQRCDCIGDRDGIGSILCQRCVSPILERLDKVWEQLAYETELENQMSLEDVAQSRTAGSVETKEKTQKQL
jgi:hypothetical protein